MKTFRIFLLLLIMVISYSCSSDLSRDNARKIILNNLEPEHRSLTITFWRNEANFLPGGYGFTTNRNIDKNAESELTVHGFITPVGPRGRTLFYHLSDRLMKYKTVGPNPKHWLTDIEVARFYDVEVTGIAGENNVRRVECVLIYKPNEVGKVMLSDSDLRKPRSFTFQKYDDGWRLQPDSYY